MIPKDRVERRIAASQLLTREGYLGHVDLPDGSGVLIALHQQIGLEERAGLFDRSGLREEDREWFYNLMGAAR